VTDVTTTVGLILALLVAMTALVGLARRLALPAPVVLVLGGLVIGFVPGLPEVALNPDLVLFVFLPPLLALPAWSTSLRDVRTYTWPIVSLAVGLVLATMGVVAVVAHAAIPGLGWPVAFALGAIVAPPDAVSATSIIARLGVPRRLSVILEGESLINDATALTAYRIAIAAAVAGSGTTFSPLDAGWDFLLAGVGGVIVGLAVAYPMIWLIRVIEEAELSIIITFLATYVSYFVAQRVDASGVIAVVVYGVLVGGRDDLFPARFRIDGETIWRQVTDLLTGLVFVLIGLQLPGILDGNRDRSMVALLGYAALVSLTVIVVRIVWNAVIPVIVRPLTRRWYPALSWRETTVVGWAGLRGVVSLAAALAIPLTTKDGAPFPHRDLVIFLTFSVILVTLVFQGLTLPLLIRRLGVTSDEDEDRLRNKARLLAVRGALNRLGELRDEGLNGDHIDEIQRHYEQQLRVYKDGFRDGPDSDAARHHQDFARVKTELIDAEAAALAELRADEAFNDDILREVRRDLDLERLRLGP
jgi:Na+/H+ antiporter